jgi:hypothetical protein
MACFRKGAVRWNCTSFALSAHLMPVSVGDSEEWEDVW